MQTLSKRSPRLEVIHHKKDEEELKKLVLDHYKNGASNFILVIGPPSGDSKTRFDTPVSERLGLASNSIKNWPHYEAENLPDVVDIARNPDCIGVIAFGLKRALQDELERTLDDKGLGKIKDDPSGDSYVIVSGSKRIKPNELIKHLVTLLSLFFDREN